MAEGVSTKKSKRKSRKKAKANVCVPSRTSETTLPAATTAMSETLEDTLFWYNDGSDEKSQTLATLKLEILGPFLFSKGLLCDKAVSVARSKELLSDESFVWPMFFDKSLWNEVIIMSQVMAAVARLCEKEDKMYQSLLNGVHVDHGSIARQLRDNCPTNQLKNVADEKIANFYSVIQAQCADYGVRVKEVKNLAVSFLHSLTDKVKLVDPVKDRGNSNFKHLRFRAAIADYSTAIKLCPFSPVLYCNRALCYLRNEDYWNACIDSYRALVLHPTWEKPYYRCAEAWHRLGEISHAIDINDQGQVLCSSSVDLVSQINSFRASKSASKQPHPPNADPTYESKHKTARKPVKEKVSVPREKGSAKDKAAGFKGLVVSEYTDFEGLQCPEVDPRITCAEIQKLCNQVKLEWCSPASYLSAPGHHSRWEDLEPEWVEPTPPTTDPSAHREPMISKFDEIWCPVLADVEESLSIIPPTFQYFSDGTVVHSAVY